MKRKIETKPDPIITGNLRWFIYEKSRDGLIKLPESNAGSYYFDNDNGYVSPDDAAKAIVDYVKEDEYRFCYHLVIVGKVVINKT